jgi:hypothetical protein
MQISLLTRRALTGLTLIGAVFFATLSAQASTGTVVVGQSVTLSVAADGTVPFSYQWYKNSATIKGATAATYSINSVQTTDAGSYYAIVSNSAGNTTSDTATLTVNPANLAPTITTQPASQTVLTGASVTFTAAASGTPAPTYQWQKNGANIAGCTSASYTIASVATGDAGTYTVVATNSAGSATSSGAVLTVILSDGAFLQRLWVTVLGQDADPGLLASLSAALAGGSSRAAVLGELYASSEYNDRQIDPAIRLYQAALARSPDYAGLQNWSNGLQAGALTLAQAADEFASSAEFVLKYGSLDNTGYVQQLYLNVLGRQADPAGAADWVGQLDSGASRGTVLVGFSESDEFKADMANQVEIVRLYFLLDQRMPTTVELQSWIAFLNGDDQTDTLFAQAYPSGLSDAAYVQAVFQGFLCRDVDAGALSTFTAGLAAGTVTHGGLVDAVLSSAEFNVYVGPVSRLYLAAFQRVPDQPGLNNWVSYLRAGNSLESMADTFAASQEFTNRYKSLSDSDYVSQLYQNVLGRAADPAGLAYWTGLLASGTTRGQVLIGFSQSPEGISLFKPTLRTFLNYYAFLNTAPTQQDLDYWTNYLTTLTDQFRETFLDAPSFNN